MPDEFVKQASVDSQLKKYKLDAQEELYFLIEKLKQLDLKIYYIFVML